VLEPGFPKYRDERVRINRDVWIGPVPPRVWDFRAGAHQVCRKWLKDRRGRQLTSADMADYSRVIAAVADTERSAQAIDQTILRHGGWVRAFRPDD
jgi:hypothetical protein